MKSKKVTYYFIGCVILLAFVVALILLVINHNFQIIEGGFFFVLLLWAICSMWANRHKDDLMEANSDQKGDNTSVKST